MIKEANFRALFDWAADAMIILDQDGFIRELNQIAHEQIGYAKPEIIGKHIGSLILPEYAALLKNRLAKVKDQGYLIYESAMVRKDGSILPVEICNRRLELDGQQIFFAVVRDISERKQAELKLLKSEEKWRQLFENMTTGFALHDVICDEQGRPVDYRFLEINPAFEQLTGLKASNMIGRTVLEALPGTEPYWIEIFGRVALSGEPTNYENYSKELGRWYQVRAFSPKIGQFAVIISDITERKQAEEKLLKSEQRLKLATHAGGIGIWDYDALNNVLVWDDSMFTLYGVMREEFSGEYDAWETLVHPDDRSRGANEVQEALQGIKPLDTEFRVVLPNGNVRYLKAFGDVLRDKDGKPVRVVGINLDITERKRTEEALLKTNKRLELAQNTSASGVWEWNMTTGHFDWSLALFNIFGLDAAKDKPCVELWSSILHPEDKEVAEKRFELAVRNGTQLDSDFRIVRRDGTVRWINTLGRATYDELNQQQRMIGICVDITERKQASAEIERLAYHDPLTRLPNRLLLIDRLKQAMVSSARIGRAGALLFIDLDNFKSLNDTLGHDIGDLLLQQVSQRLGSCIREGDTVARLGGDEFVVMLIELSEQLIEAAAQTEAIGDKILAALKQPYLLSLHEYHCTASIGVSLFSDNQQSTDEIMKQADIAMYQAKKAGRNALRFFDRQMQENISARVSLESELHKALELKQFQLYFQIQVDSSHRRLGAEALIRWIHPERGLVSPAQFIPLAEESGLILPIGEWVLETACAQLRVWQNNKMARDLILSINVSAKQFRQTHFMEQVRAAVQRHAINPKLLKLELTESLLQENIEETIAVMTLLHVVGVQFSLDDFGTGYSSLQYLKRLPLDQLKIR